MEGQRAKIQKYRERAAEHLDLAESAADPAERARHLTMAQHYLQFAQAEERSLDTATPDLTLASRSASNVRGLPRARHR
jgi:hypothetical protein